MAVAAPCCSFPEGVFATRRRGSGIPKRVSPWERFAPHMRDAVYPSPKEMYMKYRLTRSAYLLALLAAFVVASGAGHKLGG
jgi:hypothetical protein